MMRSWCAAAARGFLAAAILAAGVPLLLATAAQAQGLRLGYVEFPPYTYTDADGRAAGSVIDLAAAVFADAGYSLASTQSAPARRVIQGVADGEYDVFLGIKTPEPFAGTTAVSESVIARIDLHAWAIGTPPQVAAKEDLTGRRLIVISGYAYGGWRPFLEDPANRIELIEARTAEQALQLLTGGRAPLLLHYDLPMRQALGGRTVPGLSSTLLSSLDCHFVVSLKYPEAR